MYDCMKAKENFKIYDVTIWKQTITIKILPDIPKSTHNQTIKFGMLLE